MFYYIWVDYGNGFEPHMTFKKEDKEDAIFELEELKDTGYKAKFGEVFPQQWSKKMSSLYAKITANNKYGDCIGVYLAPADNIEAVKEAFNSAAEVAGLTGKIEYSPVRLVVKNGCLETVGIE